MSSLRIVPVALEVPSTSPDDGLVRLTVKPSSDSTCVSPAMSTWIAFVVSPAWKVTLPVVTPVKSAAVAADAPDPATRQFTVCAVLPAALRLTLKT